MAYIFFTKFSEV